MYDLIFLKNNCREINVAIFNRLSLLQIQPIKLGAKSYQCPLCPKIMAERHNVVNHIRAHTGERPYKCDFCDYVAHTKSNLKRHVKGIHGKKVVFTKETYHVEPLDKY